MQEPSMVGYKFENRKRHAVKALRQCLGYVPVHVMKSSKARIRNKPNNPYLVSACLTVGVFMASLRNEINIRPEDGVFFIVGNNCIPSNSAIIGDLYKQYHKEDLYLYLTFTDEVMYG